ncbi:MAG: NAD(P)/FAD-dependent oxidoreductase [Vicinamibacterales bacterium]
MKRDVIIVGGGPGGLMAAACLAKDGFDVAVLEEHLEVGAPVHCTGVLACDAFGEFGLPGDARLNEVRTATFVSPSRLTVQYTTRRVEAVVIDRLVFDRSLALRAVAAGASLVSGARVIDVAPDADGVTVRLDRGHDQRARAVVLACGANYGLQRRLGMGMPGAHLQSAQAELPCTRPGHVQVHFGSQIAPGGFAWAVPVHRPGGWYARIGVMASREASAFFEAMVERTREAWGIDRMTPAPRRRMLPLAPINRTYGRRVVAIGDAAGLVKATTGGGIYYSLLSARVASEVLAAALARDRLEAVHLAPYERAWKARCADEFAAQLQLREAAERMSDADIDDLFTLAQADGVMPIIRRTARFNRHREVAIALLSHPPSRQIFFRRLAGMMS